MLKYVTIVSAMLITAPSAYAGCIGAVVAGNCTGTVIDSPYVGSSSNDSNYQGSSGSSYEYDLSSPSDSNRYSTDLAAQQRDSLSLDMGRSLDQGLGQYGGGILSE